MTNRYLAKQLRFLKKILVQEPILADSIKDKAIDSLLEHIHSEAVSRDFWDVFRMAENNKFITMSKLIVAVQNVLCYCDNMRPNFVGEMEGDFEPVLPKYMEDDLRCLVNKAIGEL